MLFVVNLIYNPVDKGAQIDFAHLKTQSAAVTNQATYLTHDDSTNLVSNMVNMVLIGETDLMNYEQLILPVVSPLLIMSSDVSL